MGASGAQGGPAEAKERLAGVFDRAAPTYESVGVDFFTRWGRRLVEHAGIGTGDRVLDVGCGTGAVLVPAAEAVGPTGRVVGVDLAPGMVERSRMACRDVDHVEVRLGDAEDPDLTDASVSAVLAGLVLFFLPDPDRALRAYHRVLAPGGTLAFSTFGDEDTRFRPVYGAAAAHVPSPVEPDEQDGPSRQRLDQGPFATVQGIRELLTTHGFEQVHTVEEAGEVCFADGTQWIDWSWSHGARAMWESIPEDRRDRARDDALAALDALAEPDGTIRLQMRVRYTTTTRP